MAASLIPWTEAQKGVPEDAVGIFNHIPKTGGVSLNTMLRPHFEKTHQMIFPLRHFPEGFTIRKGTKLVLGHFLAGLHHNFPDSSRAYYFTFLREPLARAVSQCIFNAARSGIDISENDLCEYLLSHHERNLIVACIGDGSLELARERLFSEYAFFGIQEEYDLSIKGLSRIFPCISAINYFNMRKKEIPYIPDNVKEYYYEYNKLDVELYAEACEIFKKRKSVFPEFDIIKSESKNSTKGLGDTSIAYISGSGTTLDISQHIKKMSAGEIFDFSHALLKRGFFRKALDILVTFPGMLVQYEVYALYKTGAYVRCASFAFTSYFSSVHILPENHFLRLVKGTILAYLCLAHVRQYAGELLPDMYAEALGEHGTEASAFPYFDWCCAQKDGGHLEQYLAYAPPERQRTAQGKGKFHARLGKRYVERGDIDKALVHAKAAVEADPWCYGGCALLVRAERMARNYQQSWDIFERLLPVASYLKEKGELHTEYLYFSFFQDNMKYRVAALSPAQEWFPEEVPEGYAKRPFFSQEGPICIFDAADPALLEQLAARLPEATRAVVFSCRSGTFPGRPLRRDGWEFRDAAEWDDFVSDNLIVSPVLLLLDAIPIAYPFLLGTLADIGLHSHSVEIFTPRELFHDGLYVLEHEACNHSIQCIRQAASLAIWGRGQWYRDAVEPYLRKARAMDKVRYYIESAGTARASASALPSMTPEEAEGNPVDFVVVASSARNAIMRDAKGAGIENLLFV